MTDLPEPTSVPAPDAKRLFLLLRGLGLDDEQAYTFVQEVDNMAAANLIARFESKLDAQNTKLDAQNARFESKLDAQNTKLDAQSTRFESKLDTQNTKLDAQNARFESKLDAQNAKLDAHNTKLDAISSAVDSRLRMLMWLIGAAVAAIGIFVRLSS